MTLDREATLNAALALLLAAVPLAAVAAGEVYTVTLATRIAILALAAVGLNLALGLGGMVSFGHAAYFGLGGYAAGVLASHAFSGVNFTIGPLSVSGTTSMPIIWITAVVVSMAAAAVIGALSLRTSGVYFIMITLAFAQMLYYFAISWPAYGGEDGLSIYIRNGFPGLDTLDPIQFFFIVYVLLMAALLLFHVVKRSSFGLALRAAKQNPRRVESVGIDVYRLRLAAFVMSGAVTGLAGALYADLNRFVSPHMLNWHMSGEIMVLVILGGVGRLYGPVAGAVLYVLLERYLGGVSEYWQLFLGALLLAVVLYARGGLIGIIAGERNAVAGS